MIDETWRDGVLRAARVKELGTQPEQLAGDLHELARHGRTLVELELESLEWRHGAIDAVVRENWSALERLSISGEHNEERYDGGVICRAVTNLAFAPRLRWLRLHQGSFSDDALDALARSRRSFDGLYLSGLGLWDDDHWQARLAHIATEVSVTLLLDDI